MKYFNLYSNIFLTKGANRILISDLQRNNSELQSLELNDIIEELKSNSIEEVFAFYDEESKEIAQEYLDFLLEKEYGFITAGNWDKNFPPLSLEYVDYNKTSNLFMERNELIIPIKLLQSIENLQIPHLVIYCNGKPSLNEFLKLDADFENSTVETIEIFAPYHAAIDENYIKHLSENTSRMYNLVFYNCHKKPFKVEDIFRFNLLFTSQDLKINSCGKVDLKYFDTNIMKVLEAVNHNSCLHKKIGIDIHGNIKNCPAMHNSFGNINNTTLEEAILHKDFKKYWNLTKAEIEVCKDCEFRNVCTDCRAFTEQTHKNNEGLDISKPLKCGYNPYTNRWDEWSTNPLKQKAIQNYGL
ncbi:grasp-with-spasm system SPASM domain peptide maturase [Pedobacter petrophilus]|uniref:Grasp-with-spasm system SPASM domain peptide maturase n=1 Tax=Pedobacter petrophilus TaxID=1908241 RepID=A0A7K0G4S9_9SPHI|nr:grasp-with-spasm system SPASM domain peptide maturase [Pedobacter petrophilus]MRX78364.1 grasp-with-spasm system SPASM domain peptide maturase [Pedobacter petrophilus]